MISQENNGRKELDQRKAFISQAYRRWTVEHPDKKAYNYSLKSDINIRFISVNETIRHAAKSHKSTQAILHLDSILRNAVVVGKPKPPKKGVANQKPFKYLLETHCQLPGIGCVKMMVGVKRSGEMIQYCITVADK